MGIDLGSAFLQIIPSFEGSRTAITQEFERSGAQAGEAFGEQFTRDVNGRLRDSRGRFISAGEDIGNQIGQGARSTSESGGGDSGDGFLSGFKGKAMAGIAGVAAAVGAAFVASYNEALDVKKGDALIQAQMGVSPEVARSMGKQAGQLYANGYGESIPEMQAAITAVSSSMPDLMGDDLTKMTGQVASFSQAFGVDIADAAAKLNTMMNSGLAKDAPEALDLLTAGMQRVPEALRGDMLDSVDEYGKHFTALGFTGAEAFQALTDASGMGMYGLDKTGDAMGEFTKLAIDGSKSTGDAFATLGLDSHEMSNAILAGGEEAAGATNKTIEALLAMTDPSAQAQTALALFGTPLEDLGTDKIPEFLSALGGMNGGMAGFEGSAGKMDAALGSTTSKFELMYRGAKTKVVDFFIEKVLPAVADLTEWLGEKLAPVIEKVGVWIEEKLIPFLKLAWEWFEINLLPAVQRVFQFLSDSFGNFMDVIGGVIDFIAGIFTGDWERVWLGVQEIFGALWAQIQNILSTAWDVIVSLVQNLGPKIMEILGALGGQLLEWGGQLIGWIWQGIQAGAEALWAWFTSLPGTIWNLIAAAGGWLIERGGEFLSWLWQGIQNKAAEVFGWFLSLPGWLWDQVLAAAGVMVERGAEFLQWLWQGIQNKGAEVLGWFLSLPQTIWDQIAAAAGTMVSRGAEFLQWLWDGIKQKAEQVKSWFWLLPGEIWTFVSEKWAAFRDWGVSAVEKIVEGIKSVGSKVKDAILALFEFDLFSDDQQVEQLKDIANGGNGLLPGGARGAVVPGSDPGRRDNYLMPVRSEEAVMVPEWTRSVGGAPAVHAMNRAAEQGRLSDWFASRGVGMATGGVVGENLFQTGVRGATVWADVITKRIKEALGASVTGSAGASNGNWGPGVTGGFAANTAAAKAFIEANFSGVSSIGGLYGGSVPGSDHPMGKALDVMIANYRSAEGIAAGTKIADWFRSNVNAFGSKYVIWRDQIDNLRGAGWEGYSHPGGNNDTLAHRDHVHLSFLTGTGEFQGGGTVPADDQPVGWLGSVVKRLRDGLGGSSAAAVGYNPSAGVEQWRGLGMSVLQKVGAFVGQNLTGNIDRMLMQINSESSGNPNAINNYDINAQRGYPSQGLLQVIKPTFDNALRGTPFEFLMARGQTDPEASLTSSTLYSLGRYKTLDKAWRGVAYKDGGVAPGFGYQDTSPAMLTPGEAVLTVPEKQAYQVVAGMLEAGFNGQVGPQLVINLDDSDPLQRAVAEMIREGVDHGFNEFERTLTLVGAQG